MTGISKIVVDCSPVRHGDLFIVLGNIELREFQRFEEEMGKIGRWEIQLVGLVAVVTLLIQGGTAFVNSNELRVDDVTKLNGLKLVRSA